MYNNFTKHFIIVLIISCALLVNLVDCSETPLIVHALKTPFHLAAAPFKIVYKGILLPFDHHFKKCKKNCYLKQQTAISECKSHGLWENRLYMAPYSPCKCCTKLSYEDSTNY